MRMTHSHYKKRCVYATNPSRNFSFSSWHLLKSKEKSPWRIPFTICCFCNSAHRRNSIWTKQHWRAFLSYHKSLNLYRCKIELLFFLFFLSPCIRKKFCCVYYNFQQFLFKAFHFFQVWQYFFHIFLNLRHSIRYDASVIRINIRCYEFLGMSRELWYRLWIKWLFQQKRTIYTVIYLIRIERSVFQL